MSPYHIISLRSSTHSVVAVACAADQRVSRRGLPNLAATTSVLCASAINNSGGSRGQVQGEERSEWLGINQMWCHRRRRRGCSSLSFSQAPEGRRGKILHAAMAFPDDTSDVNASVCSANTSPQRPPRSSTIDGC